MANLVTIPGTTRIFVSPSGGDDYIELGETVSPPAVQAPTRQQRRAMERADRKADDQRGVSGARMLWKQRDVYWWEGMG